MPALLIKPLSIFLLALVPFMFQGSYNVIIDIINALIVALVPGALQVISLFPSNPCGSLIGMCSDAVTNLPAPDATLLYQCLQVLAWVLPMQYLSALVGCIMMTVMIFFTMAPVARWLKILS